jgi:hypothetical protein
MKFTIRDLCWSILLVACLCGWWRSWLNSKTASEVANQRYLAVDGEAAIWQGRAEWLKDEATKDGYSINWSQTGNRSTMTIEKPEVIKTQFRLPAQGVK